MKKEHILDAMDYIDPALVAAADAPAPRRGKIRRLRPVLIAACLCLALVGTAFAVAELAGVRINWTPLPFWKMDGYTTYTVEGGFTWIPADSFSPEVLELAEQGGRKNFSSWAELEQFLGWDLLDSPERDASNPNIDLLAEANEQGLCSIIIHDLYLLDGVVVTCSTQIYTDNYGSGNYPEFLSSFATGFEEGSRVTEGKYTAPSGLNAIILEGVKDTTRRSTAHFSLDGVRYNLVAWPSELADDSGDPTAVLKRVLDGFVLN